MGLRNKVPGVFTLKKVKSFVLIEVILALAVIGLLAGVVAPTLFAILAKHFYVAKIRKATEDVKTIGSAMINFNRDVANWPIWQDGTAMGADNPKVALLYGPGEMPINGGPPPGDTADSLENHLIMNMPGGDATNGYPGTGPTAWKGPYMGRLQADPWGNTYLVNSKFLWPENESGKKPVYVLSAGANETVDTWFEQTGPGMLIRGDDIVFRIK